MSFIDLYHFQQRILCGNAITSPVDTRHSVDGDYVPSLLLIIGVLRWFEDPLMAEPV